MSAYLSLVHVSRGIMRDKRKKFVELAEKRVNNALKQIELVGNLGNKSNYEYTEDDCQEIFRAIDEEVRKMKKRFRESDARSNKKFMLKGG